MEQRAGPKIHFMYNPNGFDDEKRMNLGISLFPPHCAICSFLRPFPHDLTVNLDMAERWIAPISSQVLIPKAIFESKVKDASNLMYKNPESRLFVCISCKICVHSGESIFFVSLQRQSNS